MTMTRERFGSGQIKNICVPDGWSCAQQNNADLSSLVIFTPPDDLSVQLGFYYRGLPISARAGIAFQQLLQTEKEKLSADDLDQIKIVLADVSDQCLFQIFSATTTKLSDRPVLIVQGRWQANQYESYEIFIDAAAQGTVVQQIYFVAPKDKFEALLPAIKQCLASISWDDLTAAPKPAQ
jgi:hypothetical protein